VRCCASSLTLSVPTRPIGQAPKRATLAVVAATVDQVASRTAVANQRAEEASRVVD
jgi:hypothetical protein